MRAITTAAALALTLYGCSRGPVVDEGAGGHGRYVGVGTYAAGELWRKIAAPPPASPSAAVTADDEHVVVVVDTHTGEVRECGDYTGACIGYNPWSRALAAAQSGPVALGEHLAEMRKEQQAGLQKDLQDAATSHAADQR